MQASIVNGESVVISCQLLETICWIRSTLHPNSIQVPIHTQYSSMANNYKP